MPKSIVPISTNIEPELTEWDEITALLDGWAEAERNGEQFPVPFDAAWKMAGYSTKASAKRALTDLDENEDFSTMMLKSNGGRASRIFSLTCDAFKSFCLMAKTVEGKEVRSYFIDAEKKWRLVQQVAPQVASEVEMMHMKIELAKLEAQKEFAIAQAKQADLQLVQFRHTIVSTAPEYVQQKVLGFSIVEKVDYRDRVVNESGYVLNDGSTVTKKELCKKLGFLSKSGAPDYKHLNYYLDKLPHVAFEDVAIIQENRQLRRDWIVELENMVNGSDRQKWIGE